MLLRAPPPAVPLPWRRSSAIARPPRGFGGNNDAANGAPAVVLAERVAREATERQLRRDREYQAIVYQAERARLATHRQCAESLAEELTRREGALEEAVRSSAESQSKLGAARDQIALLEQTVERDTRVLEELKQLVQHQSRLLAACAPAQLAAARDTMAAWSAETSAAEAEVQRLQAMVSMRDATIHSLQRQAEAQVKSMAESAALGERTSTALVAAREHARAHADVQVQSFQHELSAARAKAADVEAAHDVAISAVQKELVEVRGELASKETSFAESLAEATKARDGLTDSMLTMAAETEATRAQLAAARASMDALTEAHATEIAQSTSKLEGSLASAREHAEALSQANEVLTNERDALAVQLAAAVARAAESATALEAAHTSRTAVPASQVVAMANSYNHEEALAGAIDAAARYSMPAPATRPPAHSPPPLPSFPPQAPQAPPGLPAPTATPPAPPILTSRPSLERTETVGDVFRRYDRGSGVLIGELREALSTLQLPLDGAHATAQMAALYAAGMPDKLSKAEFRSLVKRLQGSAPLESALTPRVPIAPPAVIAQPSTSSQGQVITSTVGEVFRRFSGAAGVIAAADMPAALVELRLSSEHPAALQLRAQASTHGVSQADFRALCKMLKAVPLSSHPAAPPVVATTIGGTFRQFDPTGTGMIATVDLHAALGALGLALNSPQAMKAFADLTANNVTAINMADYRRLAKALSDEQRVDGTAAAAPPSPMKVETVGSAYRRLSSATGMLEGASLRAALECVQISLNTPAAARALAEAESLGAAGMDIASFRALAKELKATTLVDEDDATAVVLEDAAKEKAVKVTDEAAPSKQAAAAVSARAAPQSQLIIAAAEAVDSAAMAEASREWFYVDASNKVQGPFGETEILEWYLDQVLPGDLMLRTANGLGSDQFQPLGVHVGHGGLLEDPKDRLTRAREASGVEVDNAGIRPASTTLEPNDRALVATADLPKALSALGVPLESPHAVKALADLTAGKVTAVTMQECRRLAEALSAVET